MTHRESEASTPWHYGYVPAAIDWCAVVMASFGAVEVYLWWMGR